jgi:hypothetical protein
MKIRFLTILVIICLSPEILISQKAITLKECYDGAMSKNSLATEKDIYNSIWQLRDESIAKTGCRPLMQTVVSFITLRW